MTMLANDCHLFLVMVKGNLWSELISNHYVSKIGIYGACVVQW